MSFGFPEKAQTLPDPSELFQQLQGQDAQLSSSDDGAFEDDEWDQLPDPADLFQRMQQTSSETSAASEEDSLPDPGELFRAMQRDLEAAWDLSEDEDLPDPEALFRQMQQRALADDLAQEHSEVHDLPDPDELFRAMRSQERDLQDEISLELPDPQTLFLQMRDATAQEPMFEPPPELPDPQELYRRIEAESEEELESPKLEALPDPRLLYEQMELEEKSEPAPVGFFGRIKAALFGDRSADVSTEPESPPPPLPDAAELYRQMEEEEDEVEEEAGPFARPRIAAGGWVAVSEPSEGDLLEQLPTPEELFRRLQEGELTLDDDEDEQQEGLPELPDLEAFKAELEAEERARLDPDLLEDLSGPQLFVETISDLAFEGPSLFEPEEAPKALPFEPAEPPPAKPKAGEVLKELAATVEIKKTPPLGPRGSGDNSGTVKVEFEEDDQEPGLLKAKPSMVSSTYKPSESSRRSRNYGSTAILPTRAAAERIQPSARKKDTKRGFFTRKLAFSRQSLSIFTRQLGAMLNAGIPLHLALSFCAESDPEMAPVLNELVGKIESGFSFSGALSEYSESFDAVYIGLVQTGELSGRLNEMLSRLADVLEREIELRKRLISVVTYPSMLLAVSLLGTLGFIFFVLPQLTPLFADLGVDLPWPTKVLLGFREILVPLMISLALLGLIFWLAKGRVKNYIEARPILHRRISAIPFSIPVLGDVYEKIITARVLYALATMLDVGVTMNQALARSETASGNVYIGYRLRRAREDLGEGVPVSECFRNNEVFPNTALHLISAGEEAARLSEMFSYVASHFDEEVEYALDGAASMMEPMIMVVMGAVVGFIVIAAAMPTVQLLQNFS